MHPATLSPNGLARNPLRDAAAQWIKEMIWRSAVRFTPRRLPICLYASRRSGSTLLMEVIGSNRRVMFSDQPFSLYTASRANVNRLPIFSYGQIAHPDPDEEAAIQVYLEGLFSGEIRSNSPWKAWSPQFHVFNDRICLKITDAKCLIDWIDSRFDVKTVVLTRHPIAQALSVSNLNWLTTGKGLLRNAAFVKRWLNPELEEFCWEQYHQGSDLMRRVTDWSLENLPLIAQLKQNPHGLFVSYEDLIQYPEDVVGYLSDKLELPDRDRMIKCVMRPSRSTRRLSSAERQALIQRGDRSRLLSSWRAKVREQEIAECFHVLEKFQIDLYRPDTDLPNHAYVGRSGFR